MNWNIKSIKQMSGREVFDVMRLRQRVFTIEQQCAEPDLDDVDLRAMHVFAYQENVLIAYLRIYDKNHAKNLGRIVVNPEYQKQGYGRELIKQALTYINLHYPNCPVHMSAQYYLETYYQSMGFVSEGDTYQEAGIEHAFMRLSRPG